MFPKGKQTQGKGRPSILVRVARVAKVFRRKVSDGRKLKILTPKQMLQRLPIALAQVKSGITSQNLLNEIINSLYQAKDITENVYNNMMISIKL